MRGWIPVVAGLVVAGVAVGSATGCAATGDTSAPAAPACGRTRTAVDVTVVIKVGRGAVSCPIAMSVENSYSTMVRDGDVRGNGGGAPVAVHGGTCQGYTSAEITQNDRVSVCARDGTEIFAALPPGADAAGAPSAS